MHKAAITLVLLMLCACASSTDESSKAKATTHQNPSKRLGYSDLPSRTPHRTQDFYGPASGCTAGRIAKGWC
jgi:hypothetical protein